MSAGCALGHLPDGRLPAASKHAAPKSGTRGEIREGVFSDGITGCLGRPSAKTSGVKKRYRTFFLLLLFFHSYY